MPAVVETGAAAVAGAASSLPAAASPVLRQHLIDPEVCIRCNTCEEACPVKAITHDARNYVVDPAICKQCMACVPPCPTGAIDNWRDVLASAAYPVAEQFSWDALPQQQALPAGVASDAGAPAEAVSDAGSVAATPAAGAVAGEAHGFSTAASTATASPGSTVPPWSAAHPYTNLYDHRNPVLATVAGNHRVTDPGSGSDTHHIVLDFGAMPFPVLEGQSIGIVAPGIDERGQPHRPRQYSVASPRNGERPGYNNLALTVKRVAPDPDGRVRGLCSNYLCDLKKGDTVRVTGPYGTSFLMPNHPRSNLLMICTGTGAAPMRAMTEYRRRLRGRFDGGRLMLFFGARTPQELPYFGPLKSLPREFIDVNLAFSRVADAPRRYVQDALRERAADVGELLANGETSVFVCGLKSMEDGVLDALRDVAGRAGLRWDELAARMKREGRLHLETY